MRDGVWGAQYTKYRNWSLSVIAKDQASQIPLNAVFSVRLHIGVNANQQQHAMSVHVTLEQAKVWNQFCILFMPCGSIICKVCLNHIITGTLLLLINTAGA